MTMTLLMLTGYFSSLIAGILLGLLGGGGGLLTVPILILMFGLNPMAATASSFFIVGITSGLGVVVYHKRQKIDYRMGFIFTFFALVSGLIVRYWMHFELPETGLRISGVSLSRDEFVWTMNCALMLIAGIKMLIRNKEARKRYTDKSHILIPFAAILIGCISAVAGIGGGFLIVPVLLTFTHMTFRAAVGTSLLIISI